MQAEAATDTAEKIVSEVLVRVDALAAKLGTTVEALWPAMVAYEKSVAVGHVAILIGFAVLSLIMVKGGKKGFLRTIEDDEFDIGVIAFLVGYVMAIVVTAVSAKTGPTTIAALFSPEAAALKSLLGK